MSVQHRRRRFPGRWIAVIAAVLLAIPAAAMASTWDHHDSRDYHTTGYSGVQLAALTANPDCTLTVPADPLTAQGLSTAYVLNSAGQTCAENNEGLAAFVQAVILEPDGTVQVYDPPVITAGDTPSALTPPTIPDGSVVTIWTGFNGNELKLTGPGAGQFVNFAQQSYANSPGFFRAINRAVRNGTVAVPPLGTASDGLPCPSVRDFSVVDQDQSDNVAVAYGAPYTVSNGSDDNLLTLIDVSLGCSTWQVPLLDSSIVQGTPATSTAGPLEEVQAAFDQQFPQAMVPGLDPFVTLNGQPDLYLQNLYRIQVDQPRTHNDHDTARYCQYLNAIGAVRLRLDAPIEAMQPAPVFAAIAPHLDGVLKLRFEATYANLTCQALTGQVVSY